MQVSCSCFSACLSLWRLLQAKSASLFILAHGTGLILMFYRPPFVKQKSHAFSFPFKMISSSQVSFLLNMMNITVLC